MTKSLKLKKRRRSADTIGGWAVYSGGNSTWYDYCAPDHVLPWQQHRLPGRLAPTFEAHGLTPRTWSRNTIAQLIGTTPRLFILYSPLYRPSLSAYMRILNSPRYVLLVLLSSEPHDNANCCRGNVHVLQPCSGAVQYGHVTCPTHGSLDPPLYHHFWE